MGQSCLDWPGYYRGDPGDSGGAPVFLAALSGSARAATTKYHGLGVFNNTHLFSHTSGAWKSEIKGLASVPGESSFPDMQADTFSLCPQNSGLSHPIMKTS